MTERLKKSNNINYSSLTVEAWASAEGKSKKKRTERKDGQAEERRGKGRTETAQGW